jgi:hypothetical protein
MKMTNKKTYNFGEREEEMGLPVYQMPKYKESKDKSIEMIESNKYDLKESDFWIVMNSNRAKDKMLYSGLIISHNGCLKINEKLENKVNPKCFSLDKEGYNDSLVFTYIDDDTYEVGEFNQSNCKNAYPYAMAFKRCFDRVVLKKSKLAFSGICSEVEADEFKEHEIEEITKEQKEQLELEYKLQTIIDNEKLDYDAICKLYKLKENDIHFMSIKQLNHAIENKDKLPKKVGK